jgi:hypothetical protein
MVVMTAVSLIIGVSTAFAAHMDISLKDSMGSTVTATTPYSSKMTCGGCHFDCATNAYSDTKSSWCQSQAAQKDCSVAGNCPDYASFATANSSHTQGYANSASKTAFQTFTVKSPQHGASVGLHSMHGRNEEATAAQRTIWGAPALISGTGMFGRY